MREKLSTCQNLALRALQGRANLFITGRAGTGKSYLLQKYMDTVDAKKTPIVASTGAAAILIGGRTFHSFFGLGIMEGGLMETVKRASEQRYIVKRLKQIHQVVIDEISMIPGTAVRAAEWIARKARGNESPWGGIRIIAVGDFLQLPPVVRGDGPKDWAFQSDAWRNSEFKVVSLETTMRTKDEEFLQVLNHVRDGDANAQVRDFLNRRVKAFVPTNYEGTRLFPRRARVDEYNLERLQDLPGTATCFETTYKAEEPRFQDDVKKNAPIPEKLFLKVGALVMLRRNDPEQGYVNGSLGKVLKLKSDQIRIELLDNEQEVTVEPTEFTSLDAEGTPRASAKNFPINLAYATTIHKAQGMTLDRACIDLRGAWEHGQAYVALSRVRSGAGLTLEGWDPRALVVDPAVQSFYKHYLEAESFPLDLFDYEDPDRMPVSEY